MVGIKISIDKHNLSTDQVTGFKGRLVFDSAKPDGAPRKLTDISRLKLLDWRPQISLEQGLADTYSWYVDNAPQAKV